MTTTHAKPRVVQELVRYWRVVGVVKDDSEGLDNAHGTQHPQVMLKREQSVVSAPQIVHCWRHLGKSNASYRTGYKPGRF